MPTTKTLTAVLILLLLIGGSPPSESLPYSQLRSLLSLSHSLLARVANLRAARGDHAGAERARRASEKLDGASGLGFWRVAGSAGWDYLKNYAWRELSYSDLLGVVSDSGELLGCLAGLTRAGSDSERVAWAGRNYGTVLRVTRSLLARLLKVFRESGTIKEIVVTVQREVVDGGLLKDCLELGSNDLKGLIQILNDLALQYVSQPQNSDL